MKRLVASLAAFVSFACAAEHPPAVQALVDQGVEVQAQFDAPGGLTGYVGRMQGQPIAFYLTADGKQVIVGSMLDARGSNLTASQLERHLPKPDLESAWRQLEQATWIAEGGSNPQRVIYVFDDPDCPYCQRLWEASQPYLGDDVQIRHIPVAVISPTSLGKAARLLTADDRLQAYLDHQRNGSEPLTDIPADARRQVEANNQLMRQLGAHATPTLFYRDRQGRVRQLVGLPGADTLATDVFQKQPRQP